eukprot:GEMP01091707.1.p2 GENE.GEMP01091707.1~~GEMP01091707.1.p2  ORF type:complete len:111 (-),score=10.34 GEMP01091707.1:134-466(-)
MPFLLLINIVNCALPLLHAGRPRNRGGHRRARFSALSFFFSSGLSKVLCRTSRSTLFCISCKDLVSFRQNSAVSKSAIINPLSSRFKFSRVATSDVTKFPVVTITIFCEV